MASDGSSVEYHPLSSHVVHNETGYYHSLTPQQQTVSAARRPWRTQCELAITTRHQYPNQALEAMREHFTAERCAFGIPGEHHDMVLLRYLRARAFDVAKATEMLEGTLVRSFAHMHRSPIGPVEISTPPPSPTAPLAYVHEGMLARAPSLRATACGALAAHTGVCTANDTQIVTASPAHIAAHHRGGRAHLAPAHKATHCVLCVSASG